MPLDAPVWLLGPAAFVPDPGRLHLSAVRWYLVVETCEDWEQPLRLVYAATYPAAGLLDWGRPAALFPDRATALAAIARTEHYRLAFGSMNFPERRWCQIRPAQVVAAHVQQP